MKVPEDLVSDLGLVLGGGPAEVIEADVEPLVNLGVEGVILVANLLGSQAFLESLGLRAGAIFICSADVKGIVIAEPTKSRNSIKLSYKNMNKKSNSSFYLANTSAESTQPTMLPRWGTLFT